MLQGLLQFDCLIASSGMAWEGLAVLQEKAVITNIQGFSIHDGPGIRTVVFIKGCSLACRWCANPECIQAKLQIGFLATLCKHCGKCLEACAAGAIALEEGAHRIDYARCTACGKCKEQCYYGALVRYGEEMTAGEAWDAVRRDKIFYDSSGGGVTVSGGEPLLHPDFVRALFERCRAEGINTCVETCGFVSRQAFLEVLPVTDHFLFDLKLMDKNEHARYTGAANDVILENAALVSDRCADIVFRLPLIPGINDSAQNTEAAAEFLKGLHDGNARLELMPYHRMGQSKYAALNMPFGMEAVLPMADERIEAIKQSYIDRGIRCSISR